MGNGHRLARPGPVGDLLLVDAFGVGVVDAVDDLVLSHSLTCAPVSCRRGTRSMTSMQS